ncbi:hypothetical protein FRC18_004893, partial [Serendipita sp. 400]
MANTDELENLSGKIKIRKLLPIFDGSYSRVYQGEYREQMVAVKVLKTIGQTHAMRRKVQRERTVWGELDHPNILPLIGYAEDDERFEPFGALVSPWCANGDSAKFMERFGPDLSLDRRVEMWKGVIEGVKYLHNCSPAIVHASDVYALGCIGLDFISLQSPHSHRKNNTRGHIFMEISRGVPPAIRPEDLSPTEGRYWDIMETCWQIDPEARPTASDLLLALRTNNSRFRKWLRHDDRSLEGSPTSPDSPIFDSPLLPIIPLSPSFRTRPVLYFQSLGTELPYLSPSPTAETAYTGEASSSDDHYPKIEEFTEQRTNVLPPRRVVFKQKKSTDAHSVRSLPDPFSESSHSYVQSSPAAASAPGLHATKIRRSRLSVDSLQVSSLPKAEMPSPTTTNYTSSPTTLSPSLHQPPFLGISFGFGRPVLDARPLLTPAPIPNNVIVDSSPSRPFYIAAHSWYDLLGFLSQQRHTYLDASARVRSLIYSTYSEGWTEVPGRKTPVNGLTPQLRVVLQFVKLGNGRKRVVLYLATDNPTPIPSDYPDSDTSVIPYLFPAPDAIKPLEDTSDGRIFSVVTQPFRRLPLLMPHLSSYLQASLDESRVATDSRRRL